MDRSYVRSPALRMLSHANRIARSAGVTLIILSLCMSACTPATRFNVGFDGYSTSAANALPPGTRIALSPNPKIENTLLEAEVRQKLERALMAQGLVVVAPRDADVFIVTSFGIGSGREVASSTPVWVAPRTTTVATPTGVPVATATTPGRVESIPSSTTVYDRWLRVTAFDAHAMRDSNEVRTLWYGETTSTGWSSDLRLVLNYMIIPAVENFGRNTGRRIDTIISENDPRVQLSMP